MNSSDTAKPAETSGYAEVIQMTKNTIRTRAIAFKWLIIGFSVTGLAVPIFTAIFGWIYLLSLLFLPVFVGIFFFLDQRLTNRWRTAVMGNWRRQEVNFALLIETLNLIPGMPKNTLQGLLESFPPLARRETIPAELRDPLCGTQDLIGNLQIYTMAIHAVTYLFGALCVALAVAMSSVLPLFALGTLTLTACSLKVLHISGALRVQAQSVKRICTERKIDLARFTSCAEMIDWSGIANCRRISWINQIRESARQSHFYS